MKYPLNSWHMAGRETLCYFFGHKWKHSPRRETQYYGMGRDEVPYSFQKSTGNYMWEDIAWWSYRCTRCREKHRTDSGWPHTPWYKQEYWAIQDGFRHAWFYFTFSIWPELHEYFPKVKAPLWKRVLVGTVCYFVGGFGQYWSHFFRKRPFFPAGLALDIEYALQAWLDKVQEPR